MICPQCHTEISDHCRFCPNCGTDCAAPPSETSSQAHEPGKVCPSCGNIITDTDIFCSQCGTSLAGPQETTAPASSTAEKVPAPETTSASPVPQQETQQKSSSSTGTRQSKKLRTAIIVCLLLLIGGIFLSQTGSKKTVTEADIKEEISAFEEFDSMNMSITSCGIDERRTSLEEGHDSIQVTIIAENDVIEFTGTYSLFFMKYDNGWVLESLYPIDFSYAALSFATEETAQADALQRFSDSTAEYALTWTEAGSPTLLESAVIIPNGKPYCVYSVPCSGESDYMTVEAPVTVAYELDRYGSWNLTENTYGYHYSISSEFKVYPDQSLAESALAKVASGSYQFQSEQWNDDNSCSFLYQGTDAESYKYLTLHYNYEVICKFSPTSGWYVSDCSSQVTETDINAVGTWIYDDGKGEHKYAFDIISVNTEGITYTADITITDWLMARGEKTDHLSTNGETRQRTWRKTTEADFSLITAKEVASIQFGLANTNYYFLEFRSYSGDRYHESGFYFNDRLLTKT